MNQEHYISLIIKQLSGDLNEAQNAELMKWLAQSEANKAVKDKLVESWNKADSYKSDNIVDETGAWAKISSKLANKTKDVEAKPIAKSIPIWRKPLTVAASLILLLACSWLFLLSDNKQTISYATNANETLELTLPDGSLVSLNENSQLVYSDTKNQRIATLIGEALFEISHDKSLPFTVESRNTKTTVLGTIFNVRANDKEAIEVSLFEGKVSFEVPDQAIVLLAPGEKVMYEGEGNEIIKTVHSNENALAWKTRELKFQSDNLVDVVNTIEKYFDKNIELNLNDESCQFTGTFKNPDFKEVIEVLEYTFDLNYKSGMESDTISILGCK